MFDRLWILVSRVRAYVTRRQVDADFDEELATHLALLTEENIRRGMASGRAAREARLRLGGAAQLTEINRQLEGLPMLDTWIHDVQYAARMLRKRPGFTVIAVLTLALGIGANTAMFSVINAIFLRPLPFADADRIFVVHRIGNRLGGASLSMPIFLAWQKHGESLFDALGLVGWRGPSTLTGGGEPERIQTAAASAALFSVLDVQPALGRAFLPDEGGPGGPNVVILSDGLWHRRFQADPHVLGRSIPIDGEPYVIVGILPTGFEVPLSGLSQADLWLPIRVPITSNNPSNGGLLCLGRLKPDTQPGQAERALTAPLTDLRKDYPNMFTAEERAVLEPLHAFISKNAGTVPLLMAGAVALVLLIACLNVANLMLAAAAGRQREIAIRTAMGASRGRIARQLLTESVLLATVGGIVGVAACYMVFDAVVALVPASTPHVGAFRIDRCVLLFALALSVVTGLLFGVMPALGASGINANAVLKNANPRAGAGGHGRVRRALAANEVAISLVLLIGAALALQSLDRLTRVQPGFDPAQVLTVRVDLPAQRYATPAARQTFFDAMLARVSSLPGVEHAAVVNVLPFAGGTDTLFSIENGMPGPIDRGAANVRRISGEYFSVLRIPVHAGRGITDRDRSGAPPVVVINRAMAQAYWPGRDPVGTRIWIGKPMGPAMTEPAPREVVGVVGDIREASLANAPEPTLYIPYGQSPSTSGGSFMVRTKGESPLALVGDVRSAIRAQDRDLPLTAIRDMRDVVASSTVDWRFRAILLGAFAVLALVIAAIGVYGVIACSVAQRTQEIGVRMALGAAGRDVLALVVWQGMRTAFVGVAIGLTAAYGLTRVMTNLLFDVSATDPRTFVGIALLLTIVALAACLVPAHRAMRVDPLTALKYE